MLKHVSLASAIFLYSVACVAASSGYESSQQYSRSTDNIEIRATTSDASQRPIAGFIMKLWPAALAAILYGISGLIHWIHFFRIGQRYMLTLTIGMTCMTIGMILRILDHYHPYSIGFFIIENLFVLLSPCAFLATEYMLFTRLANSLGRDIADDCVMIPSRRITKIFVWSDVITFWVQAAGGGLSVISSMASAGSTIAMIGLILQLVSFSLFTLLLVSFGFQVRSKYPQAWNVRSHESLFSAAGPFKTSNLTNWKLLYFTLCLTCVGILIRCSFRIAEYAGGYNGFLVTHEGYFYLLDSLPLWIAMTLYCFLWPTRFINKYESDLSARGTPTAVPLVENNNTKYSNSYRN
ncbi:RTA1 like protein-domain-containing protein [Lentinula raphanica]|uniref:RTA1 like protein-domain-containing protein n=1 Tax=Lentinula raphanica TaxID=153919 RepID=A0AA38U814_9AGAR|nr:RTA1 like protein-domain-containing protein [Lentinula raphanica]KAJ3834044.1 RTA1 like protein-domain-containing protein [Lentinula raphanica]KAJ3968991.1 RTA1 like protein-domain-containing protein [Lentinula raphanica]